MTEKDEAPERQQPPPPQNKVPERPRTQQGEVPDRPRQRKHWIWPVGVAVAGLGGVAAFMLRGCWHVRMGWPIRFDDEFSYQVCVDCAAKRLFDEKTFRAYGPYGYDLHDLIARERTERRRRARKTEEAAVAARAKAEKKQG